MELENLNLNEKALLMLFSFRDFTFFTYRHEDRMKRLGQQLPTYRGEMLSILLTAEKKEKEIRELETFDGNVIIRGMGE